MKIILLKDIAKVGKKYEMKNISDGYAQNMLIPKGLAVAATSDVVKRIELERSRDEGEKKIQQELLLKNLSELEGKTIEVNEKVNDKGHLFAGLHKKEIAEAIEKGTRLRIDPELIVLDKPIKEAGLQEVTVKAGNKTVKFNLDIKSK